MNIWVSSYLKWEVSEENLHDILKNSYILDRLSDDQIISVILIIKELRALERTQRSKDLYIATNKNATSYRIEAGRGLNKENIKYQDRYLLLQDLGDNTSLVADAGDIPLYNVDKLLKIFSISDKYLEEYADRILHLIMGVNNWLDLTGKEFVIDTKMFWPVTKANSENQLWKMTNNPK